MSCSKGGFIDLRHDEMRNTVAELLDDICIDVLVEPHLALLSGDHLPGSTIDGDDAWLDISARGFWQKGQRAFCDIRVFNLFATTRMNQNLTASFITAEREKKQQYVVQ